MFHLPIPPQWQLPESMATPEQVASLYRKPQ